MENLQTAINIKKLTDFLRDAYPEILIAYVFGSSKDGTVNEGSDIDIAIYLKENVSSFMQLKLAAELEDELQMPVDIVVLNKENPLLNYEVLKNGQRLFARDETMRAFVELRIFRNYLDNKHYLMRRYG